MEFLEDPEEEDDKKIIRARSAYQYFQKDHPKDKCPHLHQMTVSEFRKEIGIMWKSIDPSKKKYYEMLAEKDKIRFAKQTIAKSNQNNEPQKANVNLLQYQQLIPNQDQKNIPNPRDNPPPQKKAIKPRAPYIIFYMECLAEQRKNHPKMPLTDLTKIIAQMWKKLSPEQKQHYKNLSDLENHQYISERHVQQLDSQVNHQNKRSNEVVRKPDTFSVETETETGGRNFQTEDSTFDYLEMLGTPTPDFSLFESSNSQSDFSSQILEPIPPNKPNSSYWFFQMRKFEQVKEKNPFASTKSINQTIHDMWKELNPFDQEEYLELQLNSHATYKQQYLKFLDHLSKMDEHINREPEEPKTAIQFFKEKNQYNITIQSRNLKLLDLKQKIEESWKQLSESERFPYKELEYQSKAQYKIEMAFYNMNDFLNSSSSSNKSSEIDEDKENQFTDLDKLMSENDSYLQKVFLRPFFLYKHLMYDEFKKKYPKKSLIEITLLIAEDWKKLPDQEKRKITNFSKELKPNHQPNKQQETSIDSIYQQLSSGKEIRCQLPKKPKKRILINYFKSIIKNTLYPNERLLDAMPKILEKWKNLTEAEKAMYQKQCDQANLEIEQEIVAYDQFSKIVYGMSATKLVQSDVLDDNCNDNNDSYNDDDDDDDNNQNDESQIF